MIMWRIQLKSLEGHRRWLTEVRIYRVGHKRKVSHKVLLMVFHCLFPLWDTYGEEHHRDGESNGGQHGQAHDEQEHVSLVDLGVGVQQLWFHVNCG